MIGEKVADMILNDRRNKDVLSHVRHVTRGRRMIVDWQYQDPAHTIRIPDEMPTTELSMINQPHRVPSPSATIAMRAMSLEALHAINMSKANSQQFRNSTIGDIGSILWSSQIAQQTIDFKTKLAEHINQTHSSNQTAVRLVQSNDTRNQHGMTMETMPLDKLSSAFDAATDRNTAHTIGDKRPARQIQIDYGTTMAISTNDGMSALERILATAPSADEDLIKTIPLNSTKRINHKQNTSRLKTMRMTKYSDRPFEV